VADIDGGRVLEILRERWPLQFEIAVLIAQLEQKEADDDDASGAVGTA